MEKMKLMRFSVQIKDLSQWASCTRGQIHIHHPYKPNLEMKHYFVLKGVSVPYQHDHTNHI